MQLLVSVRSAVEAEAAMVGGADLIDIKEPNRGPLGRADERTWREIAEVVGDRRPLSAAMGEWREFADRTVGTFPFASFRFIKFGLAGGRDSVDQDLKKIRRRFCDEGRTEPVAVAYADADRVNAPLPEAVCRSAVEGGYRVLLFDTAVKDGSSLPDWISAERMAAMSADLMRANIQWAIAGSLRIEHVPQVRLLQPNWIAVRGAVCRRNDRGSEVESERVRDFRAAMQG